MCSEYLSLQPFFNNSSIVLFISLSQPPVFQIMKFKTLKMYCTITCHFLCLYIQKATHKTLNIIHNTIDVPTLFCQYLIICNLLYINILLIIISLNMTLLLLLLSQIYYDCKQQCRLTLYHIFDTLNTHVFMVNFTDI